jgi:hypothetical protein
VWQRLHRRGLILSGVATACGLGARAQVLVERPETATMLPRPFGYDPPTTLKALFDLYSRMTAPVRVNGRGPYPFVVDTGANQSVISETLAAALGLARGPLELLNSTTGAKLAPTAGAVIGIGDRRPVAVTLGVLPREAVGAAGLLGVDRLGGQRLTLDFAGQRLAIEPSDRAWRDPGDVVLKASRRDGQLTLVDAQFAGAPVTAFLDSGAQSTIGNLALKRLASAHHPEVSWIEAPVLSVTGQTMMAQIAGFPGFRIGGLDLPTWPVAFADLHTFAMWNLIEPPALMIGVDVLSRFKAVSLDFGRDEVRFHDVAAAGFLRYA